MLSQPSPLEDLPHGLPAKQLLFFDAIAVCLKMIDLTYAETRALMVEHHQSEVDEGPLLVSRVWSLVDTINRLRLLVSAMPGLKQTAPPVQVFVRAAAPVEDLRHVIQHLNNEIDHIVMTGGPVWGVISWRFFPLERPEQIHHMFYFPQHTGGVMTKPPTIVPVPVEPTDPPVDRIVLHAAGLVISISDLRQAAMRLAEALERAAAAAFKDLPPEGAGGEAVRLIPAA